MKIFLRVLLVTPLLLISSCTKDSNPTGPSTPGTGGKIFTGQSVDLGSQTIGTSGGTFTINKPGDPLHGFQITVPTNGFAQPQTFAVTYSPIVSHQLGSLINPASPLMTITYSGGYSADDMDVKVPIKLPTGCFAMGFFYDAATGDLNPIPVVGLDSTSITVTARSLSSTNSQLGKGLWKSKNLASATMFISIILKSVLGSQAVISTGFTPGVDDWEFPNFGSYIAPHGHCTGQSATAIWYYYAHKLKGDPALFHQFDKLNNPLNPGLLWWDNPRGYRFASTIQEDIKWDTWGRSMDRQNAAPDVVFDAFVYSMLVTGRPQMVFLLNSGGQGGHAVVAYKVDVFWGKLYVADPNYPGNRNSDGTPVTRIVQYVPGLLTGSFKPYSSEAQAGGGGIDFDMIGYAATTNQDLDWEKIAQRWTEFQNGTIGDNRFPIYDLYENHTRAKFTDGFITALDTITVISESPGCAFGFSHTYWRQEIFGYDALGKFLDRTKNHGELSLALKPGDNTFGLYLMGTAKDTLDHYLDFKWMKIHRNINLTIASTEANQAPLSTPGVKNKLYTFVARTDRPVPTDGKVRYDWTFSDNPTATISVNNDSTVTHTFTQDGTYTIDVGFYYDMTKTDNKTAQASIVPTPPVITSIIPNAARVGDTVKVTGKNFGVDKTKGSVTFSSGVVATQILSWNDIAITVKVPLGTQTGSVTVTVDNLTSNAVTFTVPVVPSGLLAVAGGTFEMEFIPGPYPGQPGHPVTVGSFKIEKYEITFEKWAEVRDWGRANGYGDLAFGQNGSTPTTTNNPVTMVNWYQAVKWCNARSEKDGLTPVYYTSNALTTVYRTGTLDLGSDAVKWSANGYRLPTEAEWEFAARGGKTGTNWFSGSSTVGVVAWYHDNSDNHTHQVGTKPANELGIYDMTGNVDEWCWDWYGPLSTSAQTDPKGATSGTKRGQRGGSFAAYDYSCPMAYRYYDYPTNSSHVLGFRCVQH